MSTPDLPLVSIVTPSYNQRPYLAQMLKSVFEQDYPHIEHIVIDGGSTDGTLELLKIAEPLLTWHSEPDKGQADALNKGFRLAKGEIFCWLNCDDLYTPGAIQAVVDYFLANRDAVLVYGDALAIDDSGSSYGLRINVRSCNHTMLVQKGDFIVQPATFWRASLWHQIGPLDETLHYALDYEYWMRSAQYYPLHYIPLCLARERLHSGAKTSIGHLSRIDEIDTVARQYGGTGIPYHFRAEAAALHSRQAFQELMRACWNKFWHHLGISFQINPPLLKFLIIIITMLFWGQRSVVSLRLWSNRLRSWRRPVYPTQLDRQPRAGKVIAEGEVT